MRRIFVPREAMIAILTYLDVRQHFSGSDALFIDLRTGRRLGVRSIERMVKIFAQRAGLNPALFKPHSMRHGWGMRAGESEMYLPHIKSQLGHTTLSGSEIYINTTNVALKRAMEEKMETDIVWRHVVDPAAISKKSGDVEKQLKKFLGISPTPHE